MKVKYILNDWKLIENKIYNVFSLEIDTKWNKKIYISTENIDDFFISWYNYDYFEVIDSNISKFWEIWTNNFWDLILWISDIFKINDFWWKYWENDEKILKLINSYYFFSKQELFNN